MSKKQAKPINARQTLRERTIQLLKHRDRTLRLVDVAEGAGLTPAFVATMASSAPPKHPSCDAVQRLYEFLTSTELQY